MLLEMIGVGMICVSVYGMWNKLDDHQNKICDYSELSSLMGDGVLLTKNVRLSVKQSLEHILMVAPSGCGKSRRFIAWNIKHLKNCSVIVTDPSGELQKMCHTDKKAYVLNPLSDLSIGNNPLLNCTSEYDVCETSKTILNSGSLNIKNKSGDQQSWIDMATPLFQAYMLMNYYTKKYNFAELICNICTMPLTSTVERDENGKVIKASKSIELEIVMSQVESAIDKFMSFKQGIESTRTVASIRTVMNTCLQLYLDKNIKQMLIKENFDISKIRKEESIIYIQIPEHRADYYSPLVSTFLTQTFNYLLENDGLQVYCLFDEFANICGFVPSICKLLSTARKHNVSIVAAIQSLIQLSSVYGEIEGKELTDLFKTVLVCGGLKDSTEYISGLLGVETYIEKDLEKTKPLMTSDEVRRLGDDDMLIIAKNKRPVIDKMMSIMK